MPQQFIVDSRSVPTPTECSRDFFGFEPVEGPAVVAAFDAGAVTSDAGALLLGAMDRAIRMMELASCFHDVRCLELIEQGLAAVISVGQIGSACISRYDRDRATFLFPVSLRKFPNTRFFG